VLVRPEQSGHGERFQLASNVASEDREAFQELVREIADWRLAAYVQRSGATTEDRFVCKLSHANKRPILFLPDRAQHPALPEGWTKVMIDDEIYEANFVKVALNVVRRKGSVPLQWGPPSVGFPLQWGRTLITGWYVNTFRSKQVSFRA
jgi:hypothetical protein